MESQHVEKTDFTGKKLKNYTFIKRIGQGAWANVYLGANADDDLQTVAIKVIQTSIFNKTTKLKELLNNQIKALRNVKNPNVLEFIDAFKDNQNIFLVTQYCNQGNLEEYLKKKKKLSQNEARSFLKQILNGFQGLHKFRVIHRDLKLANIFLHNGTAKIGDLGFCKILPNPTSLTSTYLGTALTMAPQVLDEKKYGMKADIWSLGVIFYQLLYGFYPYTGDTDEEIYENIKKGNLSFDGVDISDGAKAFIKKCLIQNPQNRIQWSQLYRDPYIINEEKGIIFGSLRVNKQTQKSILRTKQLYDNLNKGQKEKQIEIYPHLQQPQSNRYSIKSVNLQSAIDFSLLKKKTINNLQIEQEIKKYQRKYVNRRNNIVMFVFQYMLHNVYNVLNEIKANHQPVMFLLAKMVYQEIKEFSNDIIAKKNIFNIDKYWKQFTQSLQYTHIQQLIEDDTTVVSIQGSSFADQIHSKHLTVDLKAEFDMDKVAAGAKFMNFVGATVDQYKKMILTGLKLDKIRNSQKLKKSVLQILKNLQYVIKPTIDIQQFQKLMSSLNYVILEQQFLKQVI